MGTMPKLEGIAITNQRETACVWSSTSGKPLYNAIVWSDVRNEYLVEEYRHRNEEWNRITGLPVSTYFTNLKIKWMIDNVDLDLSDCLFGTVDSWLIYKFTGRHITEISNASRTGLFDIRTYEWSQDLLDELNIPRSALPEIVNSAETYGMLLDSVPCLARNIPIAGCAGDQQASLIGHGCISPFTQKVTLGTGAFALCNTGDQLVAKDGLLSTIAYRLRSTDPVQYALEGSVACAGSAVEWMAKVGILSKPQEIDELLRNIEDSGGVYFVPALSGLFAPRWDPNARGTILGISLHTDRGHIARACLEGTAVQVAEVIEEMSETNRIFALNADGGLTNCKSQMQILANIMMCDVQKPKDCEITALGAMLLCSVALGFYDSLEQAHSEIHMNWEIFKPDMSTKKRMSFLEGWDRAVNRAMNWVQ